MSAIQFRMSTASSDWQWFRTFLAVMREGSLSGAARTLRTTQPTMGRQIAALEKSLGVTLFVRSIDGLTPTEAGMRLIPSAEAMAAAAEAAQRVASGAIDDEHGTVRITASDIVGTEVLPSIVAGFRKRHPRIAIELALSNRNQDLLRGDADIAIRMVRPTQGALVARKIGRVDIALHAHRRYLKAHPAPGRLEDLLRHALIGYDRDQAYARFLDERIGTGLARESFVFRSDNDLAILAALRAGVGIGPCQLGIARRDRNLVPVLHREFVIALEVWLVMHRDLRGNRRVRLAFDHLAVELASYVESSHRSG